MTTSSGAQAEQWARAFLEQQGLRTLTTNFRCRAGEIDLVMMDRETLVFVEVRRRRTSRFGRAVETIDPRKRKKLSVAAAFFLQTHPHLANRGCRFDVIAYDTQASDTKTLHWIHNAFDTQP